MLWTTRRQGDGFTLVEILATTGVIAILLAMGIMVHRSMRMAAQVTRAQVSLEQIATGMELYFQKYGTYPPQGSDLVSELAPFVDDPRVFDNPMIEEETPGETLNALYVEPSLDELDSPDNYVTAMVSSNGRTVLILKTGNKVERRDELRFIPENLNDALAAILDPPSGFLTEAVEQGDDPPPAPEQEPEQDLSVRGLINLNPRNNGDFEFTLVTAAGAVITRDTLHDSNGELDFTGKAVWVLFYPKGNGNQNSLTYLGEEYHVRNGGLYTVWSPDMDVHLYNVAANGKGKGNGKAMGRWWIEINAPVGVLAYHGQGSSGEAPSYP
jgi:prepilin-type N-terminal cleavage/methylation domain-containing protein